MKKMFWLCVGIVLIACSNAEAKKFEYPTVKDIYEDCRTAVVAVSSDKDSPQFINTLCGRQMNGVVNGMNMVYGRLHSLANSFQGSHESREKYKELYDSVTKLYCAPADSSKKDVWLEFVLAKRLIEIYENGAEYSDIGSLNISYFLQGIYRCPKIH